MKDARPRPGKMIVPGLYDDNGELHFYAEEYLRGQGVPANPFNVAIVEREFKKQFGAAFPLAQIREAE